MLLLGLASAVVCQAGFRCRGHLSALSWLGAVEVTEAPQREGPRVRSGEALRVFCPDDIGSVRKCRVG